MENPTQTNERKKIWVDANYALCCYEDRITQIEYVKDATNGWTARMREVDQKLKEEAAGKSERRARRLARFAKATVAVEAEPGA